MSAEKQVYNGFGVFFDEKHEVWFAHVGEDGKDAGVRSDDTRLEDASLKKLKERLDIIKRRKFERRPVLVRKGGRYRYGGGRDEKYEPQYEEGTMTSVSPSGVVYVVPKGDKHPDKYRIHTYGANDKGEIEVYEDTPENRATIAEIEKQGEAEWRAEVAQKEAEARLKKVGGRKLYKDVYGKDL